MTCEVESISGIIFLGNESGFFLVKKPYKMVNLYSSPEGKSMSPLKYHLLMKQIYFTSSLEAFYFLKEQPLEWTLVSRGLK